MSTSTTKRRAKVRHDGWVNALTGIGAAMRDKSMRTSFEPDVLDRSQLEAIWRGDDMAARIVETVPNEMLREGFEVCVQGDDGSTAKDVSEAVELWCARGDINLHGTLLEALCFERAYGGAAILLGVNDGELDLRKPLREDRIKTFDWMNVLAAHELHPTSYYDDPRAPFFGRVKTWRIQPDAATSTSVPWLSLEVHESRLITFDGIKVSRRHAQNNMLPGWGDSVLVRCNRVLSNFHQTWSSAGILMQDFAQAILKVKDLADLVATNQDEVIIKRAQILDMSRSVARMTLIDAEEDFERKATPMTGMPDMLQQFALRLAAAADQPVTLLLGQSPAGLNATGASDIRFFYDRIKARQKTHVRPRAARILKLAMRAKNGPTQGREPANWSIKFNALWQLSDLEQAELRLKVSQADASDISAGILSAAEVAVSRYGGDGYSTETQIDLEGRKAMESAPREVEQDKPLDDKQSATPKEEPAQGQELQVQPTLGMNGAQVASMLSIVQQVAAGTLPLDAGVGMLKTAFNLTDEQARICFGSVGSGFEPSKPEQESAKPFQAKPDEGKPEPKPEPIGGGPKEGKVEEEPKT